MLLAAMEMLRPQDARWRTAVEAFADESWVAAQLTRQASYSSRYDAKTCAALFMASYAPHVAKAVAVQWIRHQRVAFAHAESARLRNVRRLHLDHFRVRISQRFEVSADKSLAIASIHDAVPLLRAAIEEHFEPLIAGLCLKTAISRQALWRLVGDAVAAAFLDVGRRTERQAEAQTIALAVLKHPGSPLTNGQLHYFEISVADPVRTGKVFTWAFRQRGGCCRYYKAFPGHLCTICVLQDPAERDRALEAKIIRRLALRRLPERLYNNAKARLYRYLYPGSGGPGGGLRGPSA